MENTVAINLLFDVGLLVIECTGEWLALVHLETLFINNCLLCALG